MGGAQPISGGSAGLTLLELLVALTLTSLLALMAFASLNLSVRMVSRSQGMTERLQELRVGENILKRSLSSATPGSSGERVYFTGAAQEMRFFTLVPLEAHSLGGIYHWRVLKGQDEAGRGVLAVEQTRSLNWQRDPQGVELRQIILQDVAAATFTYGLGDQEQTAWDGKTERRLPDWVKVHLTLRGQKSQEWIIPIYAAKFQTTPPGPASPAIN
jgi:general secretion pathway protein J